MRVITLTNDPHGNHDPAKSSCKGIREEYRKDYKNEWYLENEYYFYVEIRFKKGKLDDICYRNTVKEYSGKKNKDPDILKFIGDAKSALFSDGHYHIWNQENFKSKHSWTSDEWEAEFIATSVEKLRKYVNLTDELYEEFIEYSKIN